MIPGKKSEWGKRIERAIDLAGQQSGSSEVLAFYSQILQFQKTVYEDVSSQPAAGGEGTLRERLDVDTAARHLPALLSLVQKGGPSKLAQQAANIGDGPSDQQRQMLRDFLTAPDADIVGLGSFFARAVFQPYAEHLATGPASQLAGFAGPVCPVCNAKPQLAVLRPEGYGGKRFLVCSLCLTEWEFRRV